MRWILQKLDNLVYLFVCPFGVLYVFPRMCLETEQRLSISLPDSTLGNVVGIALMNIGGILAMWCAALMYVHQHGSVSPLQKPVVVLDRGPYRWVRHPMMWSLNIVLVGEIFTYSSPLIAIWLLIWCRFAAIYIKQYEEPNLVRLFAGEYLEYCRRTPRWFPLQKAQPPA
jgi:protein-S-isoprenylcysteine O-methyltransferase Ste14